MKKFVIAVIALIAVLGIVLLLKTKGIITPSSKENKVANTSTSSTYSNEDIKALILKGKDNLNNMQNVYYEWGGATQSFEKNYYKENKIKKELYSVTSPNKKINTIMLLDGKEYFINPQEKNMRISGPYYLEIDYGFQEYYIKIINSSHRSKLVYLRDEKLDEKDCILVKDTYQSKFWQEKDGFDVFWIEKSTGFVIGDGNIKLNEDTPTIQTIIRNISFGIVQDSDFEVPSGYDIN